MLIDDAFEERFWSHVAIPPDVMSGCWECSYAFGSANFPQVMGHMASRVAWGLVHGEIGRGIELRRTCATRSCVNPAHRTPRAPLLASEALAARIRKDQGTSCWVWTGRIQAANKITARGYGVISFKGYNHLAHRLAYETWVAPIPAGKQIDHLCHNRACVNPEHLRVATQRENQSNLSGKRDGRYSSRFTGVSFESRGSRWRAFITVGKKVTALGSFGTEEEAAAAYESALAKLPPENR